MKKLTRYRTLPYFVFVAKDGNEFENEDECRHHEMILDGKRMICPVCNGDGHVAVEEEYDNYHTGLKEHTTIYPTCPKCNGKGYLEKTEVWK